jgi:HK97 family phage major capsid protein
MSTFADLASERFEAVRKEMTAILDVAEARDGKLNEEEQAQLAELDVELERTAKERDRARKAEKYALEAAKFRGTPEPARPMHPARDITERSPLRDLVERFQQVGYAAVELPAPEVRALQSEGGTAYGDSFHQRLSVYQRTASPMFDPSIISMNNVASGEKHVFPRLTADIAYGGSVVAEAAGIGTFDPTLGSKEAEPYKFGAITVWSRELDTDNVINLERAVAVSTGRELALDIGSLLTTGSGSSQPEGVVTAAQSAGTASAGTATQSFDFVAPYGLPTLYMSVAAPYRANGTWMASTTMITKMLEWRDANDNPIVLPMSDSPSGLGIYGRKLVENPGLAAVASASVSLAFGDFSYYEVVRLPVRIEMSREATVDSTSLFQTDQVAIRVIERVDGALTLPDAVKTLTSADT